MRRLSVLLGFLAWMPAFGAADPVAEGLGRAVQFLEERLRRDPDDFPAANQLGARLLRLHRWTGRIGDLRRAEQVLAASLRVVPEELNPGGLAGRAEVALATHHFAEARDIAQRLEKLMPAKPLPQQLLGDALLELGETTGAASAYEEMARRGASGVGSEARRSRLAWMQGRVDDARAHLDAALAHAREFPAGSPETLVWCLIQSGELAFKRGDWDRAQGHYAEALELAPNHWSALDHLAELRGAQGRYVEAVEIFTRAAQTSSRPEIWQALGDLHAFSLRSEEARRAHDGALAAYLASVERGEVLHLHHLAGFFADSQENAEEAVKWARRDLELRRSAFAWDALAWALYKQGDLAAALQASNEALASGVADSHLLQHAGMIHMSAGAVAEGQKLLRRGAEVNPRFNAFHVHR